MYLVGFLSATSGGSTVPVALALSTSNRLNHRNSRLLSMLNATPAAKRQRRCLSGNPWLGLYGFVFVPAKCISALETSSCERCALGAASLAPSAGQRMRLDSAHSHSPNRRAKYIAQGWVENHFSSKFVVSFSVLC